MQIKLVPINDLSYNTGQIKGLPKNPRLIKDKRYKKLVQSIKEDPEMLELREVIAYDTGSELVAIAGNMRLKASHEAEIKNIPTKVLSTDTSAEKLQRYALKDNVGYGEWSVEDLANEWDASLLDDVGLDIPEVNLGESQDKDKSEATQWSCPECGHVNTPAAFKADKEEF